MRKPLATTGLIFISLLASHAQAATLKLAASADYWNPKPRGYIQGNPDQQRLDLNDELGLSSEGASSLSLQLDHFLPLLPNLRITQTRLDFSASTRSDFTFLDTRFTGTTNSDIDLSHTDLTAYYRFLDGVTASLPLVSLRLEAGMTLRRFDGGFTITGEVDGQQQSESSGLDTWVPMGYAGGRISLPLGFTAGAAVNYLSYSGNRLKDLSIFAGYEYRGLPLVTPSIMAGYRAFDLKLDDLDATYGDLTLKGPQVGAYVHLGF